MLNVSRLFVNHSRFLRVSDESNSVCDPVKYVRSQGCVPIPHPIQKKLNSRLVAPTIFSKDDGQSPRPMSATW